MKISVCMATYNGEAYLPEQLDSILSQLAPGDELVVADDGSTDRTVELLRARGSQIRLVDTARVGGVVRNFERAVQAAQGDIVVLCDQDDVWLPGRLALVRRELASCDLLVMDGAVVDGALQPRHATIGESVGTRRGLVSNLWKNSFVGCCMAFRSEVQACVLPFPRGIAWHDWYIGLVAELFFRVRRVDEVTLLYRRHGANHSPTGESSGNALTKRLWMRLAMVAALGTTALRVWRRPARVRSTEVGR